MTTEGTTRAEAAAHILARETGRRMRAVQTRIDEVEEERKTALDAIASRLVDHEQTDERQSGLIDGLRSDLGTAHEITAALDAAHGETRDLTAAQALELVSIAERLTANEQIDSAQDAELTGLTGRIEGLEVRAPVPGPPGPKGPPGPSGRVAYGGGGGSATIQSAGTLVANRPILNFVSGATVADDATNNRVNITFSGGGGNVNSVSVSSGLSITGTSDLTITNTGVRSLAGSGISVSDSTGAVTITAPTVTGGTGITVAGSGTTALTVSATGVNSVSGGTGISVSGTTALTVSATGVNSIVAGTAISVSGTTTMTVNNTGVTALAGTGISVSAATGSVTVTPTYAAPTALTIGSTVVTGAAASVANSAHVHAMPGSAIAGASAVGDTAATGTAATVALSDHKHSREAFGTPVALSGAVGAGSATTVTRSDHQHGGAVVFPLGTAAAPSLAPSGDSDTGIWSPGANSVAISTSGVRRILVASNASGDGNLAVNATGSAYYPFEAYATVDGIITQFGGLGGGFYYANYANSSQYFLGFASGATPSTALAFGTSSAMPFYILTNNTARVTVTTAGNVGIGTWFTPSYQLELSTNSAAKPTSSSWTISSDARIKTVIGDWQPGLATVRQLQPKQYRLNGLYGSVDDGKVHVSVIAQEAMPILPEMIGTYQWSSTREVEEISPTGERHTRTEPDPTAEVTTLYNLDTNALQWTLVNAVKELAAQSAAMQVRIDALEAKP